MMKCVTALNLKNMFLIEKVSLAQLISCFLWVRHLWGCGEKLKLPLINFHFVFNGLVLLLIFEVVTQDGRGDGWIDGYSIFNWLKAANVLGVE